ncbi:MAG TPA: rod shape-determining protein MreD [Acidimicrobiales bacterium]|nr:rod shape-determining protein MreD [Acidimicrobiales bacterium]
MTPAVKARLRLAALLVVGFLVEATFGADLRIAGVAPDIMLLLVICAGLAGGPEQGAFVGFSAGLLADLLLTDTPFGLSALTMCLVGFAVGVLRSAVLREGWVLTPAVAFIATGLGVVAFLGFGDLVGQTQLAAEGRAWLVKVALVEGIDAAVLSIPVAWLVRRASSGSTGASRLSGVGVRLGPSGPLSGGRGPSGPLSGARSPSRTR